MSRHWEKIFSQEFNVPLEDAGEEIDRWVDEVATQEDFQTFYNDTVDRLGDTTFSTSENSAYSLRSAEEGEDLNCDGKAFLAAAAGELAYDKDMEIILDYAVDMRPHTAGQELVSHHTVVEDEFGNTYGGRVEDFPGHETLTDRISGEEVASLYMLDMAMDAKASGEESRAEELFNEAEDLRSTSGYISRRLSDWR
ncbi:MAG: hypothetical protein ABEJ36_02170 [Candidatus Nanosalina sp.]